jgi:hypothetical protein
MADLIKPEGPTMKNITFLLLLMTGIYTGQAQAGLFSFGGDSMMTLVDLPNSAEYKTENGENVDIGYLYKSVSILFVPIWNYDGRLVAVIEGNDSTYINLERAQIDLILQENRLELPPEPYLDMWTQFGGKLILLAVLGYFGFNFYNSQKQARNYFSDKETVPERFIDLLKTGYEYIELDLGQVENLTDSSSKSPSNLLLGKILTTAYFMPIYHVANLSPGEMKETIEQNLDKMIEMKKSLKVKSQNTIIYFVFITEATPAESIVVEEIKFRKTKLTKGLNAFPVILDLASQQIFARSLYPSKKVLNNCFVKAENSNLNTSDSLQES